MPGFLLLPSHMLLFVWSALLILIIVKPHLKNGRPLFIALSIMFALILWTPAAQMLSIPLEYKFQRHTPITDTDIKYIIHLSGAERPNHYTGRSSTLLNDQHGRYFETARLAALYPGATIIFSGGYETEMSSDLKIARELYDWIGLKDRAVFIGGAQNTYGNARQVAAYLKSQTGQAATGPLLLVTSALHLPRALLCFEALDLAVVPAPAEPLTLPDIRFADWASWPMSTEHLRTFDLAMHEWIGLAIYRAQGRTKNLWP